MDTRTFPLGDVLSVLTGRPVGDLLGVLTLLNWMTGKRPEGYRIPQASRDCAAALRGRHPDLAGILPPGFTDDEEVACWVSEQIGRHGETRDIARLAVVPEQRSAAA
jgi:hypothetical protein